MAGRLRLAPAALRVLPDGTLVGHFDPPWTVAQVQAALHRLNFDAWRRALRTPGVRLHPLENEA